MEKLRPDYRVKSKVCLAPCSSLSPSYFCCFLCMFVSFELKEFLKDKAVRTSTAEISSMNIFKKIDVLILNEEYGFVFLICVTESAMSRFSRMVL